MANREVESTDSLIPDHLIPDSLISYSLLTWSIRLSGRRMPRAIVCPSPSSPSYSEQGIALATSYQPIQTPRQ
jgi:hypothetical protein